jgi:hypothetical protein
MKREECRSSRQKGGVSVGFEWVKRTLRARRSFGRLSRKLGAKTKREKVLLFALLTDSTRSAGPVRGNIRDLGPASGVHSRGQI